jgi:LysR family transcriptional regulator, regulator for bpeEF and oprC
VLLPVTIATAPLALRSGKQEHHIELTPKLVVNNNVLLRQACAAGLGIAPLPRFQAEHLVKLGKLIQLLPGWSRASAPVHAVFSPSRYLAPKVRAFVGLAKAQFEDTLANIGP